MTPFLDYKSCHVQAFKIKSLISKSDHITHTVGPFTLGAVVVAAMVMVVVVVVVYFLKFYFHGKIGISISTNHNDNYHVPYQPHFSTWLTTHMVVIHGNVAPLESFKAEVRGES